MQTIHLNVYVYAGLHIESHKGFTGLQYGYLHVFMRITHSLTYILQWITLIHPPDHSWDANYNKLLC